MQVNIYQIKPFDALIGTTIKFSWNGNQVFKNRCIIKDNETDDVVYDNTIESFRYEHSIDITLASLVNGKKYNCFITVFDKDNIESETQQLGQTFLCLKTPEFYFENIVEGQVISSSSYECILHYSQENNEMLDSWSMSLYTKSHTLLATSGINYETDLLSHLFSGFTDKNEYAIRAVGKTINGMDLDTGFINLSVTYDMRTVFSLLELINLREQGAIHVHSNIVSLEGKLLNDAIYIDNEYLDLISNNNEVTFNEGFVINKDFSLVSYFYGVKPNKEVIILSSNEPENFKATVTYQVGKFGTDTMKRCFELRIFNNGYTSVFYSNTIPLNYADDMLGVCIVRKDGLWHIEATIKKDGSEVIDLLEQLNMNNISNYKLVNNKQMLYFQ